MQPLDNFKNNGAYHNFHCDNDTSLNNISEMCRDAGFDTGIFNNSPKHVL